MSHLASLIREFGLAFVFLNVFVEQAGAPVPAYPTLILAGAFLAGSTHSTGVVIAVAALGAAAADTIWYVTGRRYGARVLKTLCRISLSPDSCVRQTESIFTRWGPASMIVAKFIPGFASVSTALAGIVHMRYWTFLLFDAIGAALWAGVAIALGSLFRDAIDDVVATLASLGKYGLVLVVAALLAYVLAKWWQRMLFLRQLRMDRISVDELHALMSQQQRKLIVDVRSPAMQALTGRIPGARTVELANLAAAFAGSPVDDEVIVYCSCPNDASAVKVAKALRALGFKRVRPLAGGIDAWIAAGLDVESV